MSNEPRLLERAYQLARCGECIDISALIRRLKAEHYEGVEAHLNARSLRTELTKLCNANWKGEPKPPSKPRPKD